MIAGVMLAYAPVAFADTEWSAVAKIASGGCNMVLLPE